MIEVTRTTTATPAEVFAVLSDGWLYPCWVVGASRMRAVDAHWPAPGARLHHSFGTWPALLDDTTEVLELREPSLLVTKARGWPMGEATVYIRVEPGGDGGAVITIEEDATGGPALLVPAFVRQPPIALRNTETLHRLALIAEGRAGKTDPSTKGS